LASTRLSGGGVSNTKSKSRINTYQTVPQQQTLHQTINATSTLDEPELVCTEKELDPTIEDEIKDGFFELR
jgi:hypothetical protein